MSLLKYSTASSIDAAERTKKEVTTIVNRAVLFLRNKRITETSNGNAIKNKGVDIGCIYWKMFNSVGLEGGV
jgi:U3 small nucleolar ribonucleoprotein component